MSHPIFARLDDQLRQLEEELGNLQTSERNSREIKKSAPRLYDEWTHRSAIAGGVRSVYSGLESIMNSIANEIDQYEPPRGEHWHEKLIDQLAVSIEGVRGPLLGPGSRLLFHELRKFRHVVHHHYAQNLEMPKVVENHARLKKAFAAFKRDYRRFSKALQAA